MNKLQKTIKDWILESDFDLQDIELNFYNDTEADSTTKGIIREVLRDFIAFNMERDADPHYKITVNVAWADYIEQYQPKET